MQREDHRHRQRRQRIDHIVQQPRVVGEFSAVQGGEEELLAAFERPVGARLGKSPLNREVQHVARYIPREAGTVGQPLVRQGRHRRAGWRA